MEKIFKKKIDTRFIGFDSFNGFGEIKEIDKNPSFKNNLFTVDKYKVIKNIKKNSKKQNFKLIEGFYQKTLKNKNPNDYGINKSRLIMIDCDLKESTTLALNFAKPSFQEGTIIIFDDFNFYKGNKFKGEFGAFKDFKSENPNIEFRKIFDYGYSGRAFIITNLN